MVPYKENSVRARRNVLMTLEASPFALLAWRAVADDFKLTIARKYKSDTCTSGYIAVNGAVIACALEFTWQGNAPLISSIPVGRRTDRGAQGGARQVHPHVAAHRPSTDARLRGSPLCEDRGLGWLRSSFPAATGVQAGKFSTVPVVGCPPSRRERRRRVLLCVAIRPDTARKSLPESRTVTEKQRGSA